jgi:hypothetical protein
MKQISKLSVLLLLLVASACSALATDVPKQDLGKLRAQIGVLESVLNQNLSQAFPGPFGYLDKARGAYLPGYGMVFTFEVNLNPQPPSLGPFGGPPPQTEAQRIAAIKKNRQSALELTERVLADFGHTLEIGPDESIAFIVQGSTVGPRGMEKSTAVVRAQKRDIDQLRANAIDRAAFLNRVAVVEY